MHATFTSGAARRRDLDEARLVYSIVGQDMPDAAYQDVNTDHDAAGRINPILDLLRDEWDSHEAHAIAVEYLFQLARHWSAWQDARIGTFPLDYRDPEGPLPRNLALESGEDRTYWEIDDVLTEVERTGPILGLTPHQTGNLIQDYIVHAVAVLDRIYDATEDDA